MSVTSGTKTESGLGETVRVVVHALLIALVIRTFLFQPFNIPSGSMKATLLVGDYLFVSKYSYGYSHFSIPQSPNLFAGRIFGSEPRRGDIVVFRLPKDTEIDYIKRVVGLPGDKLQMIDGVLNINGKPVPRVAEGTFTSDDKDTGGIGVQFTQDRYDSVPVYRETLDSGATYQTLDLNPMSDGDNTNVFTVPAKHYFMMGDNRDNSSDSRFTVGYVPEENLVGRASFIMFSLSNQTPFLQVWKWPTFAMTASSRGSNEPHLGASGSGA